MHSKKGRGQNDGYAERKLSYLASRLVRCVGGLLHGHFRIMHLYGGLRQQKYRQ